MDFGLKYFKIEDSTGVPNKRLQRSVDHLSAEALAQKVVVSTLPIPLVETPETLSELVSLLFLFVVLAGARLQLKEAVSGEECKHIVTVEVVMHRQIVAKRRRALRYEVDPKVLFGQIHLLLRQQLIALYLIKS